MIAHRPGTFKGVTGEIPFSAVLDDLGEVFLARVEEGAFVKSGEPLLEVAPNPTPSELAA